MVIDTYYYIGCAVRSLLGISPFNYLWTFKPLIASKKTFIKKRVQFFLFKNFNRETRYVTCVLVFNKFSSETLLCLV